MAETIEDSVVGAAYSASAAPVSSVVQEPGFSIRLFGPFSVLCRGVRLPRMRSRKEQSLLALLVLRARENPVDRLWLAGTLWPESNESNALFYLRRSLNVLRDAMGPEGVRIASPTPRTLFLDLAGADCDVAAFDGALRRGDHASLARAVDLYRETLLADCSEDWVFPERDKREQGVLAILEKLASRAKAAGQPLVSISHLRRILEIDPLRESALRDLMAALAASGNPAAAGETYRVFRARLRRDYDADPDGETVRLHQRVQSEARERSQRANYESPMENLLSKPPARANKNASIPAALSPLIGRQREHDAVVSQIGVSRLVTLTGTGGAGKTRLSLAVAESVVADFEDGVWFVDLTSINAGTLIARTVLSTLCVQEIGDQADLAALEAWLQPRDLLLILDNCEHLIDDCARIGHGLLKSCPDLRILATSREPLRIPEETVWPVPRLAPDEASELFTARAVQASLTFRMSPVNRDSARRICDRLEGVPLAIEMAAARTRGMSAPQIAANLDGAFRLLNLPVGHIEPRHQTLRATMRWSYDLLTAAEQILFARLSLFSGGWTLEAAEAVCGADPLIPDVVLETLLALVDKSLVVYNQSERDLGRYSFLEMTRQYAAELLAPDEHAILRTKHADFFIGKAIEMRLLQGQHGEHEAVNQFEPELPNVRSVLHWCQSVGRLQCGLRLAGCLGKFWLTQGHVAEGRQYVTTALDAVKGSALYLEDRIIAAMCVALLAKSQGDWEAACQGLELALPLAHTLDSDVDAPRLFPDPILTASVLFNLTSVRAGLGDRQGARQCLVEALALWQRNNAEQGIAKCRYVLGQLALDDGDLDEAETQLEQALAYFESSGNLYFVAQVSLEIAAVMRRRARHFPEPNGYFCGKEKILLKRALAIAQTVDAKLEAARAVEALARLAGLQNRFEDVAQLYGAGAAIREALADIALTPQEIELHGSDLACCRDALGPAGFDAAFEAGRAMSLEQAVELAFRT